MKYVDRKLAKFLLVGIANTVFGAGVMFLLYNAAGCSYWFSSVCNYICGGILSYFLNKYFTFQNKKKSTRQVLLFILTVAVCYVTAYLIAKNAVYWFLGSLDEKVKGNISLLCGTGLYTVLNYFGQRLIVFKTDDKHHDETC